jgi:hypothetical protein
MKVFLAGIMQGSLVEASIHSQDWRKPLQDLLCKHLPQARVYCHYSRHRGSIEYQQQDIVRTMEEGIRLAGQSDLLVAYLPSASMGTAIEMYEAFRHGSAVLTISPLAANWVVRCYSDRVFADLASFEAFLATHELGSLLEDKKKQRLNHREHKEHEEK